jgi:hypothetical protein
MHSWIVDAACEDAVSVVGVRHQTIKLDQFDEHRIAKGRSSTPDNPN